MSWNKFKHKYIAKIRLSADKVRYFYDRSEYEAYLAGQKKIQTIKNSIDSINSKIEKGKEFTGEFTRKINTYDAKKYSEFMEKSRNFVSSLAGGLIGLYIVNKYSINDSLENTKVDKVKELPKINIKESNDSIEQKINENYSKKTYPYTNNCAYCSVAYDLRKRGYDVEAAAIDRSKFNNVEKIMSWYKGAKLKTSFDFNKNDKDGCNLDYGETKSYASSLEKSWKKEGNNTYGHCFLRWKNGGGHVVTWSVENNKPVVRDSQNNTVMSMKEFQKKYLEYAYEIQYFRSDNLELNDSVTEAVRIKKRRKKK